MTDFAGGSNFVVLVILTLILGGEYYVRQIIVTAAVCLWGLRISGIPRFLILHLKPLIGIMDAGGHADG